MSSRKTDVKHEFAKSPDSMTYIFPWNVIDIMRKIYELHCTKSLPSISNLLFSCKDISVLLACPQHPAFCNERRRNALSSIESVIILIVSTYLVSTVGEATSQISWVWWGCVAPMIWPECLTHIYTNQRRTNHEYTQIHKSTSTHNKYNDLT